jgi:hypothetical protein
MVTKKSSHSRLSNIKFWITKQLRKPTLWLPFNFLRWIFIDSLEWSKKSLRVSGMDMITGRTGSGKTLALCERASKYREKWGNHVLIGTNFYWSGQDFALQSWKQIDRLPEYGNLPVIIFIDEIQKEFASSAYKDFPPTLFDVIGEARKLNLRIEATTQYFRFADNKFREYCHTITEANNFLHKNRLFHTITYDKDDYTRKEATKDNQFPPKLDPVREHWFVADDEIYNMYNTYEKSESIKKTTYNPEFTPFQAQNLYPTQQPQILLDKKLLK